MVKALGMLLVVAGVLAIAYGGFSLTHKDTLVDVGPIEITADDPESLRTPPIAAGVMLVAGLALMLKK